MSMDSALWQSDADDNATDPDVEWAFFGSHDIEYWVVRDGRLVPAESSELERIAEWERERIALPRLRHWERSQAPTRLPSAFVRFVSWCGGLGRRVVRVRLRHTEAPVTEINGESERAAQRRTDLARS